MTTAPVGLSKVSDVIWHAKQHRTSGFARESFLGETLLCYWDRLRRVRSFVHSTRNKLLEYLENRLTQNFYTDIRAGYDIIIYFRLEVIGGKQSKISPLTASGRISREWVKLGS